MHHNISPPLLAQRLLLTILPPHQCGGSKCPGVRFTGLNSSDAHITLMIA